MLAPYRSRTVVALTVVGLGLALATLLRFVLDPLLGDHVSFSFYFLAVSVAAWTGGMWYALLTAVLGGVLASFFFTHPPMDFGIHDPEELFSLAIFVAVSLVIGVLSEISLRALDRAKEAERVKDEFMATVAHELRSPLTVIHYANTLNRNSGDAEARDHTELIDRQVYRLNLLIEELLDLSRVAHGKVRLNRQHVEASTVVAAAVEKARPLIAGRKHTLRVDMGQESIPLYVDPIRLEQVMTNLLTNAAKYTPDGGTISVTLASRGSRAVFTVRDSGIGISAEMLPRVFDLFVQSNRASDRADGGLGIGLALVRKLVELHGGSVYAASRGLNRGSEFVVTLPLEQPAPAPEILVEA